MNNEQQSDDLRHVGQTGDGKPIEVQDVDDQQVYIGGVPTTLGDRDKDRFHEHEE